MNRYLFIALAAAVAVVAAPTALAQGGSQDDRPFSRAPALEGTQHPMSPDDRSFSRNPVLEQPQQRIVGPDDRSLPRSTSTDRVVLSTPQGAEFNWGDAIIGGVTGLGGALLLIGGSLALLRYRDERRRLASV